jgi:hypothetical protein
MKIFVCFVILISFVLPISAQVEGRLTGSVIDAEGESVTNATVSLSLAGGAAPVLETVTTSDGIFSLPGVRPDFYDVTVTVPGYQAYTLRNLKIDPARETSLPPFVLKTEQITLTVDVNAPLQTVQTNGAAVATTITNEQVRRLPIVDRIALPLVRTQPGITDDGIINGQRSSSVNVTLDGINIRDNYLRNSDLFSPNLVLLDQIAELTITTTIANASLGGGSSHINLVTPSGSNEFHGAAYFYNRNNALAANSWFNNKDGIEKSGLNQNWLGGSFAGPIKRDKLHFYTNYEAFRYRTHATTLGTILTQDARNGIFTYEDASGQVRKVNILQAAAVSPDPAMQQLLAAVPGPEKINSFRAGDSRESLLRNTAGYSFIRQGHHNRDNVTFKLDHNLSTANTFTGSFIWNRQELTRSDLVNDFSTVPKVHQDDKRKLLSLAWRWNPRPALTNEIRGGFNLAPITFDTDEKFGERLITNTIYSNPVNLFRSNGRNTNTFDVMDNAAWSRGSHLIQWGFQTEQIRVRTSDDFGITPTYFLGMSLTNPALLSETQLPGIRANDLSAANALLATLAGFVSGYSQTFNITNRTSGFVGGAPQVRRLRLNNSAFYVQDAWKVVRRLTLNAGIRYELPSVVDERDSLYLSPKIENGDPVKTLLSNATLDFAGSAVGRPLYARDKNNVAPNVGLAWDVFGDGRMSARAGYSISYVNDETIAAVQNYISFNEGLIGISSRTNLSGRLSTGLPPIPAPVFKVPRTFSENFSQNPFTAFGLPDPNLRTPYVQQWTGELQREIGGSILEVRYVGNHATKLFRGFDLNPEMIQENGFLNDFNRARNNGNLARAATGVFDPGFNPNIAGSQPLPVFNSLALGGLLTNAFVRSLIQSGQAGELASQYFLAGLAGSVQFYRNPVSLASLLLANPSNTSYNALQLNVLRRFRRGLQFQGNYTYGKVLSDTDGTASHRFEEFRNPADGKIDRSRPTFDVTHAIKGNAVYELPFGTQRWRHVLGGWAVSGIMTWQSGNPFSIVSKRGTLIRAQRSTQNTASSTLTKEQLDQILQFRMTNNGPFIVAASAIGNDGRGVAPDGSAAFSGQAFSNPNPGEIGGLQRRWFSGPWRFDFDLGVLKKIQLRERHSVEFRLEALNALNHPTWFVPDQDINSVSFGRLQNTANESRKLQLSLRYQF